MRLLTPHTSHTSRRTAGALAFALSATLLPAFSVSGQGRAGEAADSAVLATGPSLDFVGVSEGQVLAERERIGVRGSGGVSGLTLVLENESGEPLATSAGSKAVVLMTGPPEARRPWTASEATPGFYRLRARGLDPDQGMMEEAVRFEVGTPSAAASPGPFRAGFTPDTPERWTVGDAEPIALDVSGAPSPGEDVLVVAWDPERLEMRDDFTHVLDGPPWDIDGGRLAGLGLGEVELQVMSRRSGEVFGVARHPLAVTPRLSFAAAPPSQVASASVGGGGSAALGSPASAGGTEAVVAAPQTSAQAPVAGVAAAPRATNLPISGALLRAAPARVPNNADAANESEASAEAVPAADPSPAEETPVRSASNAQPATPEPVTREVVTPEPATPESATPESAPREVVTSELTTREPVAPEPSSPTASASAAPAGETPSAPAPQAQTASAPATQSQSRTAEAPAAETQPQAASSPAAAPAPQAASAPAASTTSSEDASEPEPTTTASAEPEPASQTLTPAAASTASTAATTSGFTSFPVADDARILYVSSSQGSDSNNGLTPQRPFASVDRAKEFLRDGYPDRLLLKAGDVFEGPFGFWGKSGRSATEPMVVSTYGEGDRPLFRCGLETGLVAFRGEGISHVMFQGFELLAQTRVPGSADFKQEDASEFRYGIIWRESGGDILFEDLKVTHFAVNIEITGHDGSDVQGEARRDVERQNRHPLVGVTVNRCILTNAYAANGHGQGLFTQQLRGMVIRETLLDHNGWNEDVPGAVRTIFNHNLYCYFTLNAPVVLERNIITRGASHGAQVRPGGTVRDNFFDRNALALLVIDAPSVVTGNVILESDNINDGAQGARGVGIEAESCETVEIRDNLIARKVGDSLHAPAISVDRKKDIWYDRIGNFDLRATVTGNTIYEWTMNSNHRAIQIADVINNADVRANKVVSSEADQPAGGEAFVNADASVESYLQSNGESGGLERFVQLARERPRGVWDPRWSAAGVNTYLKQAFEPAPFD